MKSKDEIRLEIMRKVVAYEKKRLRWWYEVVTFVLIVILISEVVVAIDLFFEIGQRSVFDFTWVLNEDFQTVWYLSGSILNVFWEELPWYKICLWTIITVALVLGMVYTMKGGKSKRFKASQIRKYEKSKES